MIIILVSNVAVPTYSDAEKELLKEAIAVEFGISGVGELTYTKRHVELGLDSEVKITHRAARELIGTYGKILEEIDRQKKRDNLINKIQLGAYELAGGSEGLYKLPDEAYESLQEMLLKGRPVPQHLGAYLRHVTPKDLMSMSDEELRHVYREIIHMPKESIVVIPETFAEEGGKPKLALKPYDVDAVPVALIEPMTPELDSKVAVLRDYVPLEMSMTEPEANELLFDHEFSKVDPEENGDLIKRKDE